MSWRVVAICAVVVVSMLTVAGCRPSPSPVSRAKIAADETIKERTASVDNVGDQPSQRREVVKRWSRAGYQRPPVVDFHGHLSAFGVDRIASIMDGNGIDLIVNLSGGSGRRDERAWVMAQMLSRVLGGRIINFANVDWKGFGEADWARREADRLDHVVRTRGFRGLKISKALGLSVTDEAGRLAAVDDARIGPLWAKAAELRIPVSIHVADPRAFWLPLDEKNERFEELSAHPSWSYARRDDVPSWSALLDAAERLYKAQPKTTFVAVHFGNAAEDIERVDRMLDSCPNVWIDISARVGEFGRHKPERVRAFFIKHQDRILFGSDIAVSDDYLMLGSNGEEVPKMAAVGPFYEAHFRYLEGKARQIPHPSPIQGRWKVDAVELPAKVLDKVYRLNAVRLLGQSRLQAPSGDGR